MDKQELEEMGYFDLNNLLREKGLNPAVSNEEDKEIAINILLSLPTTL